MLYRIAIETERHPTTLAESAISGTLTFEEAGDITVIEHEAKRQRFKGQGYVSLFYEDMSQPCAREIEEWKARVESTENLTPRSHRFRRNGTKIAVRLP